MDYLFERVAYLRGLCDGSGFSEDTKEGKVLLEIVDILGEFADSIVELSDKQDELEEYAEAIKESSVVVWVDKRSSFGAVPIEAMKCGTPVIGLLPYLLQEWMGEKIDSEDIKLKNNVIWVGSILDIPEVLYNFCQSYVTDTIPNELYVEMDKTIERYKENDGVNKIVDIYTNIVNQRVLELKKIIE